MLNEKHLEFIKENLKLDWTKIAGVDYLVKISEMRFFDSRSQIKEWSPNLYLDPGDGQSFTLSKVYFQEKENSSRRLRF